MNMFILLFWVDPSGLSWASLAFRSKRLTSSEVLFLGAPTTLKYMELLHHSSKRQGRQGTSFLRAGALPASVQPLPLLTPWSWALNIWNVAREMKNKKHWIESQFWKVSGLNRWIGMAEKELQLKSFSTSIRKHGCQNSECHPFRLTLSLSSFSPSQKNGGLRTTEGPLLVSTRWRKAATSGTQKDWIRMGRWAKSARHCYF